MNSVELSQGTIQYRDDGEGRPIVFVHGILVNGLLWRHVTPHIEGARCIVPHWPLGSHEIPMRPNADLSPPGLAKLVADFAEELGLDDVVLVDNFLPPMFRGLQVAARVPGALTAFLEPLRVRPARNLPIAFGWLRKRPIEPEISDAYVQPYFDHAGVRRDLRRVLTGISTRHTLDAAEKLNAFDRPALIAWSAEDRFFPLDHARRLADILPQARLVEVEDSYTFSPEDQPERLAELITEFATARVAA